MKHLVDYMVTYATWTICAIVAAQFVMEFVK